ncbi:IS3 family transposase [Actinomyces urogenitalis]|uniref:IS3 family transposase n=2 Tax=Actinomyces urogenitalis TaxID=103621 RepID=UPI0036F460AD
MEAEKAGYPIALMTRVLGVTRAGFYAWGARGARRRARAAGRRELDRLVAWELTRSNQAYGAGRITVALRRSGARVGVKAVAASMRRQGLSAVSTRQLCRPEGTEREIDDHEDRCRRQWDTGEVDKVWVTGFTYLRCGQGWVYLCAVRDAHSRRVLGWAMSSRGTPARSSRPLRWQGRVEGACLGSGAAC